MSLKLNKLHKALRECLGGSLPFDDQIYPLDLSKRYVVP